MMQRIEFKIELDVDDGLKWKDRPVVTVFMVGSSISDEVRDKIALTKCRHILFTLTQVKQVRWEFNGIGQGHYLCRDEWYAMLHHEEVGSQWNS